MSVIKSKRQEGKLQVLTQAQQLAVYTVQICKNEKHFPKRDRWIMTQPIVRECLDAVACIRRANAVRIGTQDDYTYRRHQQVEAHSHMEAMLTLMDIAYNALGIDSARMEYWTGLVIGVDNLVRSWQQSDRKRHPAFSHGEPEAAAESAENAQPQK